MDMTSLSKKVLDLTWQYGPKLLIALALLFGGLWVIRRINKGFHVLLNQRKVDPSLHPFFSTLVDVAMKVGLILAVASQLGFETTSFIAILSALAFAVGLALQGSLGNFASGILILLMRPYKIGDLVTIADKTGYVCEIQIYNTIIETPAGARIIIPNGKVTEGPIENIPMSGGVRAEISMHVSDRVQPAYCIDLVKQVVNRCPTKTTNTEPFVVINGFEEDSMQLLIGCWTTGEKIIETRYALYLSIKEEFDRSGVMLAQRDEA